MGEVKLPSDDDGEEIAALLLPPPETSLDDLNALFSLPPDNFNQVKTDTKPPFQHPRADQPPSKGRRLYWVSSSRWCGKWSERSKLLGFSSLFFCCC